MELRSIFRRSLDFLDFLAGAGSWRLHELERLVVDAVIGELPASIAGLVRRQLEQPFFIERQAAGRINVLRFYRVDERLTIREADFSDKLYKVRLTVDSGSQTAHVRFFNGHIFCVELKNQSRFYVGKKIEIRSVATGAPENTYTREIDEAEHGPSV